MLKVLVADHDAFLRERFAAFLRGVRPDLLGETAATGQEVLERCLAEPWDAVLLDHTLPVVDALTIVRHLTAECPGVRVIITAFYLESDHVRACLDAGAVGYVAKDRIPDDIDQALTTVLAGQVYLSAVVAEELLRANGQTT